MRIDACEACHGHNITGRRQYGAIRWAIAIVGTVLFLVLLGAWSIAGAGAIALCATLVLMLIAQPFLPIATTCRDCGARFLSR